MEAAKGVQSIPPSSSSSSCFITNIPYPILMEILCRLPIKTLIASQSVCKSWLHLIRDPHFSELHQARAQTEICFRHDDSSTKLNLGDFCFVNDADPLDVKLDTLLDFPRFIAWNNNAIGYNVMVDDYCFANACNGLFCYYGKRNKDAVVWNPCTSEFITFPAPETYEEGSWFCDGYGFGFSRKANKFKLLRMIHSEDTWVSVGEICTIEEACSWKTIGPPVNALLTDSLKYVTLLQGTLHWVSVESCVVSIQTFDFEDDQFGTLPVPPYSGNIGLLLWDEALGVLSGCLALTDHKNEGVDIWLMKEYGVQDSWTKLFSLEFIYDRVLEYEHCRPITYMDNGEILMTSNYSESTHVFFYNPILESVRVIGSGPDSLRVITYRPSLVPLKDSMLGYRVHAKPVELRKVLEELRKEREQRKELEERLRNELAKVGPLREQIEQLKQQNQQLEKRLREEHPKVEQLNE